MTEAIMAACGVDGAQSRSVAENLVWTDLVGRSTHGVDRLPVMMQRVRRGLIRSPCTPRFAMLSECVENLDADTGFGQHAGLLAIERAIALARLHGVGVVGVHNSNFFGTGAYFVERAAREGCLALAFSNSVPQVAAAGGFRPALGTNPFAFGAPRQDGRSLLVDMSTAGLAGSTVRAHARSGTPIPVGFLVDDAGNPVTDPSRAGKVTLLPASGPKGFGLALLVEVFSGVLTGAGIASEVASLYKDFGRNSNSGHFFLVLDIRRWMPLESYYDRFERLAAAVLASGDAGAVRLPGALRWDRYLEQSANGISLEPSTRAALEALAAECAVAVPWLQTQEP